MLVLSLLMLATGVRWLDPAEGKAAAVRVPAAPADFPGLRLIPGAGVVQVQLPSMRWASVTQEQDVLHGTRVRVLKGAHALLLLDTASQVEFREKTVARVEHYRNPELGVECWLLLQSGQLKISKEGTELYRRFLITTPWASFSAEGERIELLVALQGAETRAALTRGALHVETGLEDRTLRAPITFFIGDDGSLVLPGY
ncbi:MAG: hypothetical protein HY319_11490 [Armatimonadetes bacterium]|nr:hypothetical protein [Armatimonadota bacterium]